MTDKLHFQPSKVFVYDNCVRRILVMDLGCAPEDLSPEDRPSYIRSLVDLSQERSVCALGGLLSFLDKSLARLTLGAYECNILAVKYLSLDNILWMDTDTLMNLQIFAPKDHPSSFKWSWNRSKEGFSIFGLFNQCASKLGTRRMRTLMSQPTKDRYVIESRLEVIKFCLESRHAPVVKNIRENISHVQCVSKILTHLKNGLATVNHWLLLHKVLTNAIGIAEFCHAHQASGYYFEQIGSCLDNVLYIIAQSISRIMDKESSLLEERFIVSEGICEELDRRKVHAQKVCTVTSQVAQREIESLPPYVESCRIIYVPEIGYLLTIKQWKEKLTQEEMNFPGLEFKFAAKDYLHYKSPRCVKLDECLGDSQMSILEQESRIMMNLIAYIQSNISPLIKLLDLIAELDCLFALSIAAQEHNLTCPTILPPGSGIQIKNGRHPLQELNVESFVPNDFQAQKVHILTGPNACGKSVYLKQVALIIYLAHLGSFVPAEEARVNIVDYIHCRINTAEATEHHMSAFMCDLRQVTNALLNSTRHSLIILDEFGKGTLEMDGLALLTSSLNHLIAKHDECPLVLVATHFFSLASLLKPEVPIQQLTFKHRMEEEDIVYLYSIEEGNATCSLAHQVALSCGLPPAVVKRGQDILETFRTNQTIEPIPDQLRTMRLNRINAMTESFKSLRIENEEDLQKLINSLRQIL
uniref:MutS protein homolog 5 n=1 Tax=Cacopsylla melanoneura TaxID=428564 RepID=A0A8D8V662_9HEMI